MVSFSRVPVPFCTTDSAGFLRSCNALFSGIVGYAKDELLEISFEDLVVELPKNRFDLVLAALRNRAGPFSQRLWLKRKDGSTFPAILSFSPSEDHEGRVQGANIVVVDDTYSYHAISWATKDKEEMRRKERLKDEFVAIASHELRTPIQPILGFALLAKRGTITQEAAWEGVLQEARRLQQLANDILDVSRIESDNLKYDFSKVKINELIQHAVESVSSELSKDVSLSFRYDPSESEVVVDADRSRITQVISNLVGNAIKFTQIGNIKIESKLISENAMLEIRVSDTGGGIPEEIRPKLFEKFATKGHGEGNKNGTGLGLYITRAIVVAHNGTISAINNPQGGATFTVTLPLVRAMRS
jgi:PAS domain S-box-containing protein